MRTFGTAKGQTQFHVYQGISGQRIEWYLVRADISPQASVFETLQSLIALATSCSIQEQIEQLNPQQSTVRQGTFQVSYDRNRYELGLSRRAGSEYLTGYDFYPRNPSPLVPLVALARIVALYHFPGALPEAVPLEQLGASKVLAIPAVLA